MERLTSYRSEYKREMICKYEDCNICEEYCPHLNEDNCLCLQEILEKLAEYEDLEEQGKLLKLPLKFGERYYRIVEDCANCPIKMTLFGCDEAIEQGYQCEHIIEICRMDTIRRWTAESIKDSIGKTIFITKEEAEYALNTMKQQRKEGLL